MASLAPLRILHWVLAVVFLALGGVLLAVIDGAVRELHEMGRGGRGSDAFADDMMLLAGALFLAGIVHGVSAELAAAARGRPFLTVVGVLALLAEPLAGLKASSAIPALFFVAPSWGTPALLFLILGPAAGILTLRACWMSEPSTSAFAAGGLAAWMEGGGEAAFAPSADEEGGYEEPAPPPQRRLAAPRARPAPQAFGGELDDDGSTRVVGGASAPRAPAPRARPAAPRSAPARPAPGYGGDLEDEGSTSIVPPRGGPPRRR